MRRVVLDTNIVSAVLRRHETARTRLKAELAEGTRVHLCPVVQYEVLRGLRHKGAHGQERRFHALSGHLHVEHLHPDDWLLAADLWAEACRRGRRTDDDADVLIAAYAHNRKAVVVTDNVSDFEVFEVPIENWRAEE